MLVVKEKQTSTMIKTTIMKKELKNDELLSTEKTIANSPTYVPLTKLAQSVQVLRKLEEQYNQSINIDGKKSLFEVDNDNNRLIRLQVEMKKILPNVSTFIHSVSLPWHWRHEIADYDTCLIVPDHNREPLTDRDLDLEQTKGQVFDLLEAGSATELIKEILPTRQLRNEFRPAPLRQKLAQNFSAFLCDRKLLRNRYDFLSRFLGKAFWIDSKKVPIAIDLMVPAAKLRSNIESALNQTQIYTSGKGATVMTTVGSLGQKTERLVANLESVLIKLHEFFPRNVRTLTLKTDRSLAVTFYMDLGSSNIIQLPAYNKKQLKIDNNQGNNDVVMNTQF